jgi:hypothetical protein
MHGSCSRQPDEAPEHDVERASLRKVTEALLSAARDPTTCWTPAEAVRLRRILEILSRLAPPSKQ